MGFIEWFFGSEPINEAGSPQPKEKEPKVVSSGTGTEVDPMGDTDRNSPMAVISAALRTAQAQSRIARYDDFDKMDTGDIAYMLDAVLDGALTFEDVATGRGFKIEADKKAVDKLLQTAVTRAGLREVIDEIGRDLLKYGDAFAEPLFEGRDLVDVQTYKCREIFVSKNDKGRFPTGKDDDGFFAAYQQKRNGKVVAGWQPWELIHIKFKPSKKKLYSEASLLDPIRVEWRKLQLVELGMVTARVTRAYPRRIHYLDMTNKDRAEQERSLRTYITRMTNKVLGKKPVTEDNLPNADVGEDLYLATGYIPGPDGKPIPRLNKVETEDPAIAGLAQMEDVLYLRQKVWSGVPSDTVGIRRNTTGDLDAQDLAYVRMLRRFQVQLEKGIRAILDQVLLLNGYIPQDTAYRVIFPTVDIRASWKFADARFRASLTLRNYLEMGAISRRWALKQAFNVSDLDIDAMWKDIEEEANNPIFLPVDQPARNGLPSIGGDVTGAIRKAAPGGGNENPTGADVVPATGANTKATSTTKNGISRSTDLGKRLAGSNSGG